MYEYFFIILVFFCYCVAVGWGIIKMALFKDNVWVEVWGEVESINEPLWATKSWRYWLERGIDSIKYNYEWEGEKYNGKKVSYADTSLVSFHKESHHVDLYHAFINKQPIIVYVNKNKPEESFLKKDYSSKRAFLYLFIGLVSGISLILIGLNEGWLIGQS